MRAGQYSYSIRMNVVFDVKLLAALRERIVRLKSEPFSVYGYQDDETLYVLAGWFDSDGFEPPVSDTIGWLGSIVHSSHAIKAESVIASTDETLSQSMQRPLQFTNAIKSFSTVDLRSHVREEFFTVFIKGLKGCMSPLYADIHSDAVYTFPVTEMHTPACGRDALFLVQVISTDSTYSIDGEEAARVGLISRSGFLDRGLNSLWHELNEGCSRCVTQHFQYIHIPVHLRGPPQGSPVVHDQSKHPNTDVHYLMKENPLDGIIAQDGYQFCHYNMDGYNDSGWGCAYRSIQTMLSWFISNFNVSDSIPLIEELQSILKKSDYSFQDLHIGSKQWIGCIEAGIILREVSHGWISHKILSAFTIEELEDLFMNEVHKHILNVGSPVMVGAGDYAFTVVGVSQTDKSVFVIDPHFVGGDYNLALSKGNIEWKNVRRFFEFTRTRSKFINICIPFIH